MKKVTLLIQLLLVINLFAQRDDLLTDNDLVFFYDFDSLVDGKLADLSENKLHGEMYQISDENADGMHGNAFYFDHNQESRVFIGNNDVLKTNQYTIMAWFKGNNWDGLVDGREILEKTQGYWLVLKKHDKQNPNELRGYFEGGVFTSPTANGDKTNRSVQSKDTVKLNKWYHGASVYNGDSLSLYLDGKYQGSTATYPYMYNNDLNLVLGTKQHRDGHFINQFNGSLDDIIMLQRPLTEQEIQHYIQSVQSSKTNETFQLQATVWPNPSHGAINIEIPNGITTNYNVNIYNCTGNMVFSKKLNKTYSQINFTNQWQSGVYLVKITDGSGNVFNQKIMVKRN